MILMILCHLQHFVFTYEDEEEARKRFSDSMIHKPSCVVIEADMIEKLAQIREQQQQKLLRQKSVSILGQVHYKLLL